MRNRTTGSLIATVVLLGLCPVAASGSSPSAASAAKALYTKLLKSTYAKSDFPAGYASVKVSKTAITKNSRKYHVAGLVAATFAGGPDAEDVVIFYVFPTAADARGDLTHPDLSADKGHTVGKVPGINGPSLLINGSITGKDNAGKVVTNGITGAATQSGTVIVAAATVSVKNTGSGDLDAAVALLRSGLAHLAAVEKH